MDKNQMKQTKFDSMVTTPTMQLVKAVIPYIDNPMGRYLGMFIKLKELQNASMINNNVSIAAMNADKHRGMESMLEDIIDFMGDETRETFENIKSIMEMMETMNDMDMNEDMMNAFMGSAFSGNDNSPFQNNNESSSDENDNSSYDKNDNSSFNENEDFTYDNNMGFSYDKNDDVTSSTMSYKKGFNGYE